MHSYRNPAIAAFLLLLSQFAVIANSQRPQDLAAKLKLACPERCSLAFRCDPYYSGPPVWAIVDDICKLFKTDCIFASVNCHRQNECRPRLVATSQQICQLKCVDVCDNLPSAPVCASFPYVTVRGGRNDGMLTFKNQCELDKWSCWNAKAYVSVQNGTCF
ncbi:PREDICTED: salivary glue protein Sgs-5-like [Rhagoletis zephyria]|uniref:salivary glue protein Sgs-5-like n=1 Tax=Rhagoletis zephyria TaxID=28612 RepID=UPI00081138C7|nr:PREDICTED: salivary glue protein Sgs-5-like [Rhagoletis zephyria]